MTYTSHAITLHTRHVPTILAALRFRREHRAAVLASAERTDGLPPLLTPGEQAMWRLDLADIDEAIAAIEAAR